MPPRIAGSTEPSLGNAIHSVRRGRLPHPLPVAHVSAARWLAGILADRELRPRACKVFKRDLLYLFYGGVFYRPKDLVTRSVAEYPVAFLFDPHVLALVDTLFPFDTGAMASGRFGDAGDVLRPWKRGYKVASRGQIDTASRLVRCVYRSNEAYLVGDVVSPAVARRRGVKKLAAFLSADLSHLGADHRQCIIECQMKQALALKQHLLWVGMPESAKKKFWEGLTALTYPSVPRLWCYQSHRVYRPSETAAMLQAEAHDEVQRFIKP